MDTYEPILAGARRTPGISRVIARPFDAQVTAT
jgi:hypothetical protein